MPRFQDYTGYYFQSGQPINYTFNVNGALIYPSEIDQLYQPRFRSMLERWSSQSDIIFQEASNRSDAHILVSWAVNGRETYGDGPGGAISASWRFTSDSDSITGNSEGEYALVLIDKSDLAYFEKGAIMAIGNALGINNVTHTSSVMNPDDIHRITLTDYDISLVQSLYGTPGSGNSGEWSGTDLPDYLNGAPNADIIYGGAGSDTIRGDAGDDLLYGNKGEDHLVGSFGDDTIYGGQNGGAPSGTPAALRDGRDFINGEAGNDLLYGNHGGDRIFGQNGDDTIYGGQDNDTINGGIGNDVLFGNLGSDIIQTASFGNDGHDTVYGFEIGVDFIEKNNDTVAGYSHIDDGFLIDFGRYGSIFLVGISTDDANTLFIF